MPIPSFLQTLTKPLRPTNDVQLRRMLGVSQAVFAIFAGWLAVRLFLELRHEHAVARAVSGKIPDMEGAGFSVLSYLFIPATVLLAFGAISVWRNWTVKWWLPLLTMLALGAVVRIVLA